MTADSSDQPRDVAIEQLEEFGLSSYAARTYVALVRLGKATAEDVSRVANVPRTRVYDAAEELRERGIVDVQHTTPRQFAPVSPETTGRLFFNEYARRVDRLTGALDDVEPAERPDLQRGVWTVTGRDAVSERVVEFIEAATDELVYMTVADLLTEGILTALRAASDRGVTIRLAGLSDAVRAEIHDGVPNAEVFDTMWSWTDTPAGRLLLADGERTLVSVLVDGEGDHLPEPRDETAIWGVGETNSLVVVLRTMFAWQLDDTNE